MFQIFKKFFFNCTVEKFEDVDFGLYHEKIRKIVCENLKISYLESQINILKLEENSDLTN